MLIVYIRSILLYLLLILTIRMMGKRQIGEMEPSEFVVALLLADLAAVPMQDIGIPLMAGIIPLLTVLAIELLLSVLTYRFISIRKLFCGKPVILIENGIIQQNNLKKTRLTIDELTEHLREQSITDLTTVKFSILETNGQISALLYPEYEPVTLKTMNGDTDNQELPITLISEGKVIKKNLPLLNKTPQQISDIVKKYNHRISDVFLLTETPSGKRYFVAKETTQ